MNLRDYQVKARTASLAAYKDYSSALVVMPTGTGKTILFASMIKCMFPRRSMVVAHRQELIWQARDKIQAVTGLRSDVEMGEHRADTHAGLFGKTTSVVASIQTLTSGRLCRFDPNEFGQLIIDEAHHAVSASYRRLIEYCKTNPKLKILGVTATPDRGDEEALGQIFETVAYDYEILDAINDGWLVPVLQQMVDVSGLDFSGVRTTAGDLNGADLAAIMESEKNLHGVAGPTIDIVGDKSTLVFTSSVKHAEQLSEIFNRHKPGLASWVCGKTDLDERNLINEKFKNGDIQILCNCGTHTEGFDADRVAVIVMAKPTKSRALYAQMVGRSTRPIGGIVDCEATPEARRQAIANSQKPNCLVIDFVGNSGKHKLVTTFDILGGNVSDDVVALSLARARQSGKPVAVAQSLEDEEKEKQEREKRRLAEEARRHALVAKAKYNTSLVSPFDILQIKPVIERGWDQKRVLSEKQRAILTKRGIDPDKLSFAQGRQLVTEIMARQAMNMCTFKQAKTLKRFDCDTNVSFDDARRILDAIAQNGWKKPANLVASKPKGPPPKPPTAVQPLAHASLVGAWANMKPAGPPPKKPAGWPKGFPGPPMNPMTVSHIDDDNIPF